MKSSIFKHPPFLHFLLGRASFSFIDSVMSVALAWHLYQASKDPFDLALVGLFQITPVLALFLVTGWVVDHVSRKKILVIGAMMQLVVVLGIALIMQSAAFNKWHVLLLISLYGTGKAFMSPALQAILPNLVTKNQLNQALAITSTVWNIALTVGPFVAGLLIAWVDHHVYWLLVAMSFVAFISFLKLPAIGPANHSQDGRKDLLGGFRFLKINPIVLGSLSLDLFIVLLGSVVALLPIYAADILHVGPTGLGMLRAMPAIGAVLIGLYLSHFKSEFAHTGHTLFIALGIFALSVMTFAFSTTLWLSAVALFVYGASDMFSVVIRSTVVQHNTPDKLRGRVSAVNSIFIACSNQLGDFRAGSLAAAMGPVNAAMLGGTCALFIAVGGALTFRDLRQLKSARGENKSSSFVS